jgi:hypothetical protein
MAKGSKPRAGFSAGREVLKIAVTRRSVALRSGVQGIGTEKDLVKN